MGRVKQSMFDNEANDELIDFLSELITIDGIEDSVLLGIAKQVVDKGVDSMSEKQKYRIDSFVEKYKESNVCDRCVSGNIGSLTDYIFIADDSQGLCPSCRYDYDKVMAE